VEQTTESRAFWVNSFLSNSVLGYNWRAGRATAALMEAARRNGLPIGKGGAYGNCIRISPPMNIARSDADEFARLLDASLEECVNGTGS
jgi:4-aminobutyrate aminotransferase-like enzyme